MPFYLIYGEGGIAYDNDNTEVRNLQLLSPLPYQAASFNDAKQAYLDCPVIGEMITNGAYDNYVIHEVLPNCITFDSPVPTTNDTKEVE
jgi:hypothetical protein